jgi:hypothetical protein
MFQARTILEEYGIMVPTRKEDPERFECILDIIRDAADEFKTQYEEHPVSSEQPHIPCTVAASPPRTRSVSQCLWGNQAVEIVHDYTCVLIMVSLPIVHSRPK